jgi:type I restriction enzyme S subunit
MKKFNYRNTDLIYLDSIPEHWKIDRIKDKTTAVVGGDWGNDPESDADGENIVVLRVADLDGIYFKYENLTIRKIKSGSIRSRKINDRCLIIEKSGGGEKQLVGRVGYPKGINFESICSNFMAKIEFDNTIDLRFMNYVFSNLYSNKQNFPFVQQTTGIQNLNVTYYLNTKVAFPPITEQILIREYLDKACIRIDKIIAIKEKQLEEINKIRKSRIDELVCFGFKKNAKRKSTGLPYLPEINANWRFDRFKDVARLRDEKTDEKSEKEDYLELEDFEQGTGKILNKRNTLEVESKVTKFYRGDVLFGKLRPYLEKYHYADFDGKCTGEVLAFQPFKINGQYLKYILGSKWFIDLCNSMSYGAKMPRVNWTTQLASINIPLPSEEEQIEIVKSLDALSDKIYSLNKKVIDQIDNLKEYRKSIIHECVTGKKQVAEIAVEKVIKRAMA